MTPNLKILGLALVATLAMSTMAASSASSASAAEEFWFKSDGDWTALSGSQGATKDVLTLESGQFSCNTVTYAGSTSSTTTASFTLKPTYAGCQLSSLGSATFETNSCGYVFTVDKLTAGPKYDVETEIECTKAGDEITIKVWLTSNHNGTLKCTTDIPAQKLGTGIVLTNSAGKLSATINFTNITFSETAGTGLGACSSKLDTTNGTYTGSATIEGKNTAGAATSIAVE